MTPEQEKEVIEGLAHLKTSHAALSAKVPELEKTLAAKDAEIAELKKGHSTLTQGADLTAFKSAYPDVPENVFHSTAPEKRAELGKSLQEHYSKLKGSQPKADSGDPLEAWTRAGGIGPMDDATIAAEQKAKKDAVDAARKAGDPLAMLKAKGSDVMNHLVKSLRAPVSSR